MLFSSITFLFIFLPCVMTVYFIAPNRAKNYVLLLFSMLFYAWGEPKFIVVMIVEIIAGYILGLLIAKFRSRKIAKLFMAASLLLNIGLLVYFKYADFLIESFNNLTGGNINLLKIALPIGISFYTFQIQSYLIDVYRGEVPAQKNPFILATYVSMFPQLIAGPIVRYVDVEKQLSSRIHSFEQTSLGIRRFIIGLAKKVLLSNALGELCKEFRNISEPSVGFYWLYAVAFTLQIYFDFSGYSDMAIGLGKIFGFNFMENFNYPYISKSITEFWRRWHISLGTWFRDYVYIPLGGNRCSKIRWLINIGVVWFLTGLWHGAAWNFIIWGFMYAVLLLIEKLFLNKYLKKAKLWNHIYVMLMVIIGFVIFNASDMSQAVSDILGMIPYGKYPLVNNEFIFYLKNYGVILIFSIIGATPAARLFVNKINSKTKLRGVVNIIEPVIVLAILIIITGYLVDGSFNPFLYFRF